MCQLNDRLNHLNFALYRRSSYLGLSKHLFVGNEGNGHGQTNSICTILPQLFFLNYFWEIAKSKTILARVVLNTTNTCHQNYNAMKTFYVHFFVWRTTWCVTSFCCYWCTCEGLIVKEKFRNGGGCLREVFTSYFMH